ncbi:MAG: hypothetical protein M4579_005202 [Chaenotheca gracillima]|nr:MAG: hypothetical protein M4579_005202 [Chaenotheca gracillima]
MASTGTTQMQYRFLGRSGLQVSAISLGGWLTYGGTVENDNTFACMKAAYDAGVNFFDCAEGYAGGESERVMGDAIRKFGWKRNDIIYWGMANGNNKVNNGGLSRKHLIEGLNASLERLQLDYVDLVYAHRPDRNTPMEETVRAFNHLIDNGKAFYWGTSEWNADEIAQAWRVADRLGLIGPLMEQPQYNLLARNRVEQEYWGLLQSGSGEGVGMGLTIFSPLKGGILTGKYNEVAGLDSLPEGSRFKVGDDSFVKRMRENLGDESWKREVALVKKLEPIAKKLNATLAALSLAWVLKNPHISSAITGASKPEQVGESLKALDLLPKMTDAIMKEIDEALGNKPEALTMRFF